MSEFNERNMRVDLRLLALITWLRRLLFVQTRALKAEMGAISISPTA
jgi:hypothetical protein